MPEVHVKLLICQLKVEQLHTYTCFSCRFWSWMHVLHYSWFIDVKFWLNQGITFSSIGLRHLLWDFGQTLGIWSHNYNPLYNCGVNLRRYKIHKSCSTMSFFQQLFRYKTFTETETSKESGRSGSCKVCLYGNMRSPWGRAIGLVGLQSSLQTKGVCVSGWFHYWRQSNAPVIIIFKKLLESKSRGKYT